MTPLQKSLRPGRKHSSNPRGARQWQLRSLQMPNTLHPAPLPVAPPPTSPHFTSTDLGRKGSVLRSPRWEDSFGGGGCPGGCW